MSREMDASHEHTYDWWNGNTHHIVFGTRGSILDIAEIINGREKAEEEASRLRKLCAEGGSMSGGLEQLTGWINRVIAAGRGEGEGCGRTNNAPNP